MQLKEQSSPIPLISGYGEGGFRIAGKRHDGHLLISPAGVHALKVNRQKNITKQSLKQALKGDFKPEFLLFGLGREVEDAVILSKKFESMFKLPCEVMTTGAAVRTYNVLVLEGRRLAAAIFAV